MTSLQRILDRLKSMVAAEWFVAREWRIYSDVHEMNLTVRFKFMCPCGNDIVEQIVLPHPASPAWFDDAVVHAGSMILKELRGHLEKDG